MTYYASAGAYPQTTDNSGYTATSSGTPVGIVGGATKGPLTATTFTDLDVFHAQMGHSVDGDYGILCAEQVLAKQGIVVYKRILKKGTKATAGNSEEDALVFTAKATGAITNKIVISETTGGHPDGTFSLEVKTASGDVSLEKFTGLSIDGSSPKNVTKVLALQSKYITATIISGKKVADKEFTLAGGTAGASYGVAGTKGTDNIVFTTKTYDSTMNGSKIDITKAKSGDYFNFIVSDSNGNELERLVSLSDKADDSRYFVDIINSYSDYVTVEFDSSVSSTVSAKQYVIKGGSDGISGITTSEVLEGLQAFADNEITDVRVLCACGYTDPRVAKAGDAIASGRGDCEFLVDPPFGIDDAQDVVDWTNGKGQFDGQHEAIGGANSACYAPWMILTDTHLHKDIIVPPSVLVAASYVNSDKIGNPWDAPAGLTRGKITTPVTLVKKYTQADRDILNGGRNCVNPIISYYGEGIVIWGQKTMQRNSTTLDRLNVVRLLHYLRRAITLKTAYSVFEGSDQILWDQWVLAVEPILEEVKSNRGLYDYTIEMKYGTTISTSNLANHITPGVIKLLPTQTAEIIPIDFQLYNGAVSFSDLNL